MKNTSKILALVLVLMTVLMSLSVLTASAAAGQPEYLYLTPNANWKSEGARFAAYFFGNGETWVSMTDNDKDGVYEVKVPTNKKYPNVIFCRMNPKASANNWNNKWNQTGDLAIPTTGANHYTVPEGTWDKANGTWSTFGSTCAHEGGAAATCTTAQTCTKCGDVMVAALGHTYGADAVCTRCTTPAAFYVVGTLVNDWEPGNKAYPMTRGEDGIYTLVLENVKVGSYEFKIVRDGSWGDGQYPVDNNNLKAAVSVAGSTVTVTFNPAKTADTKAEVVAPHVCEFSDPTCTEPGKCSCGLTQGEALGHTWGEWVVDTPATEESEGSKHRDCSVCEETETAIIPTLQHVHSWTIPATCTEPEKCVCGQENGEALGHTWSDATCTTPKTCSVCNTTEGTTLDHTYVNGVCSCGAKDPNYVDYYLIGYINGKDYGDKDDWANLGEYKFVDGKLVVTFTEDSYIGIKSAKLDGTIAKWYWCAKYTEAKEATFIADNPEKMKVPGNVEITFTLTVNADGTLTLVADYHTHTFSKATCTEPAKCECGVTQGNALGHDLVVDVEAKAPTCTTAGNTEGSHCSRCDAETVVATEIPATGHDDNFIALGVCTKCYTFNYWLVGDNAITVTESHPLTTAGNPVPYEFRYIYITEAGHYVFYAGSEYARATIFTTPVAADGKVDTSKYSFNIAWLEPGVYWVGVNFHLGVGEYTLNVSKVECTNDSVVTAPTCTEAGYTTHTCTLCGHKVVDSEVAALDHDIVVDEAVAPTCTETGLTAGQHCSRCDGATVDQEEVPSLGHDWSEGNECSRCQAPKCAHEWSETVVAPTCVKDGYTLHACSKCGENYKDTTVPATGSHTWVETVVPPTCTEAGSKTNTCSVCGETKTEEIPATGHFYVIGICQNPGCTDKLNMLQLGANTITVPQGMLGNYEFRYITITEAGWYQISCNNPLLITCIFIDNIYAEDSDFSIAEDGTLGESWNGEEDYGSLVYLEEGTYVVGLYYTFVSAPGDYTVNIDAHEHSYTEGKCVCGAEDPDYVPEDPGQQPGGDEPSEPSDPSDDPSDDPTTPAPQLSVWDKIVAFLKKILAMILGFFKK